MPWVFLIAAGALEIVWAIGLKQSDGFTRLIPSSITIIAMLGSFGLLGWAIRDLPVGIAYAVWTGIGTLGVVLVSAIWLREGLGLLQMLCVIAIGGGIVGLKMLTKG
jgi:quaternary ammonium compound-resistance protein SugE